MIGQSAIGKTSILYRFVENQFLGENLLTTVGVDLKSITLSMDEMAVRLQIWDTAGQE
jgi:GTPase SAR1 family protein